MRKKIQQKYGLFMQSTCLYRTSSFHEKRIDTAESDSEKTCLKNNEVSGVRQSFQN